MSTKNIICSQQSYYDSYKNDTFKIDFSVCVLAFFSHRIIQVNEKEKKLFLNAGKYNFLKIKIKTILPKH